MISKEDIEKQRTPTELWDYVQETRRRVEANGDERSIGHLLEPLRLSDWCPLFPAYLSLFDLRFSGQREQLFCLQQPTLHQLPEQQHYPVL